MRDWVKTALTDGTVNSADTAFADLMQALATIATDELWCASVLASAAVQNGDVCVTLATVAETSGMQNITALQHDLQNSGMVQEPEQPVTLPLVLDNAGRLYLSRYWHAERDLAESLQLFLNQSAHQQFETPPIELLEQLFPSQPEQSAPDWQRVAAVVAARQRLCVITGGPGTGKTRTVARLLAVLQSQITQSKVTQTPDTQSQRIALLAPTGKAAARLLESLRIEVNTLKQQGLLLELPDTASTLHRALGYQPGRAGFRHNAANPLPYDLVLVDEASMVDLTMMHSVVSALATDARLILLGDRDQLASVEAGNVLGDIVGDASPERYSTQLRAVLKGTCKGTDALDTEQPSGGIADAIVELQHSYRFDAQSGIGHFARAVNAGDADTSCAIGADDNYPDLQFINPEQATLHSRLLDRAATAAIKVIETDNVESALSTSLEHRVLCALYAGPRGVDQVNLFIEARLIRLGHIQPNQLWYKGRPILVTRNDPGTGLYNGDTGLIWPDANGHLMAWFADGEGAARAVAPGRLPAHQTCFAMTVHKTQGSEFTHVLLVLPEPPHSLLSRDLLYTGITRARKSVEVYGSEEAVRVAVETKRVRASGLRDRLWGGVSE
ncbi:exodeoxyribonuclease V subunit alpha [Chromatiales bacterium (ex Bugula neritina AB1)]|nr:exodeoxyribonuclease V subunit alpha [Chromatiales bacterium (ex Bugula neritina AB1)]